MATRRLHSNCDLISDPLIVPENNIFYCYDYASGLVALEENKNVWTYEKLKPTSRKLMLEYFKNHINIGNENGDTPLIVAIQENTVKMASFLISNGADINVINKYGNSALLIAIDNTSDIISLLLEAGADPNQPNPDGITPIRRAAEKNLYFIVLDMLHNRGGNRALLPPRKSQKTAKSETSKLNLQIKKVIQCLDENSDQELIEKLQKILKCL